MTLSSRKFLHTSTESREAHEAAEAAAGPVADPIAG